ncbi:MAG: alginate lyase [Chitinophagaceae bacterium BSSC1]|nr:MAG: alginate lyase [Chitinophagaceae bacterium BSSC1]
MSSQLPIAILLFSCTSSVQAQKTPLALNTTGKEIQSVLAKQILQKAKLSIQEKPITVTAFYAERSAGNQHDFFSEGDYWWPDDSNPQGPYIQKDGQTNPNNFVQHRLAMIRFSQLMGNLVSAYLISGNKQYATAGLKHLNAWFVDTATRMNPSLLYAQAIKGKVTGRGVGIIDMIQMMEVAQSIRVLEKAGLIPSKELSLIKQWFANYLQWVTTHAYGKDERDSKNNHASCWVMQVLSFAQLTKNDSLIKDCSMRYQQILLPGQLALDGSFPLELKRTKPYGYSLFNLDAMTMIAYLLKQENASIFLYQLSDGRNLRKAIEFMVPYVQNKSTWPFAKDVMFWDQWPIAQPFLIFGYQAFHQSDWLAVWKKLEHFPENQEVIRNLPIRNPLIWLTTLD